MSRSHLEPLGCTSCGAAVPLRNLPEVPCVQCGKPVVVPEDYRRAASRAEEAAALRERVEPHWKRLVRPPARAWQFAAAATVLGLPVCCSAVVALLSPVTLPAGVVVLGAAFPALAPGTGWWVWVLSTEVSAQGLASALAAAAPPSEGEPPGCRRCGAPLPVDSGALSATCGYCGADSLVEAPVRRRVASALGDRVATLQEAVDTLRRRRWVAGFGVLALGVVLAGLWVAAAAALVLVAVLG